MPLKKKKKRKKRQPKRDNFHTWQERVYFDSNLDMEIRSACPGCYEIRHRDLKYVPIGDFKDLKKISRFIQRVIKKEKKK